MKINCSCLLDRALYASNISNDYEDFFVFTKGRVMSIVIWCNVYCILYILPFFFFLMECGFQTACTRLFLLMLGLLP